MLERIPHTYTTISSAVLLCTVFPWIIPAGECVREIIDVSGTSRTVIIDHSLYWVGQTPQTWQVFSALPEGSKRQAGTIAFLLTMGGVSQITDSNRAIGTGIFLFLNFTKGFEKRRLTKSLEVDNVMISLVIILFSLFGSVFSMSEETLAFVIIIVPLAISVGYDSITGLYTVYAVACIGSSGIVLNPSTIGIAQGLSDLPLFSGSGYRMLCWLILTTVLVAYVLRHAVIIEKHPEKSLMYHAGAY